MNWHFNKTICYSSKKLFLIDSLESTSVYLGQAFSVCITLHLSAPNFFCHFIAQSFSAVRWFSTLHSNFITLLNLVSSDFATSFYTCFARLPDSTRVRYNMVFNMGSSGAPLAMSNLCENSERNSSLSFPACNQLLNHRDDFPLFLKF